MICSLFLLDVFIKAGVWRVQSETHRRYRYHFFIVNASRTAREIVDQEGFSEE